MEQIVMPVSLLWVLGFSDN